MVVIEKARIVCKKTKFLGVKQQNSVILRFIAQDFLVYSSDNEHIKEILLFYPLASATSLYPQTITRTMIPASTIRRF